MTSKSKKILVVDDEPDILTLIEEILFDYEVVSTTDPLEALEIFKAQNVALVISDYKMPGLNGFELYEALKRESPNVFPYYLITTGFGDDSLENKAYKLGINEFFKKPIDEDRLRASVASAIAGHP